MGTTIQLKRTCTAVLLLEGRSQLYAQVQTITGSNPTQDENYTKKNCGSVESARTWD